MKKKKKEVNRIISNLYEDKINGVLSQDTFIILLSKYEKEKKNYDKNLRKAKIKTEKASTDISIEQMSIIMDELLKFDTITEENKSIVFKLIDKIIINDRNISIKYKFKIA
ncbi:MAG: hypothetical protein Q4G09_05555 [Clostridia bacterium]|nr:hypothetical protein [Clostridia bacterium]